MLVSFLKQNPPLESALIQVLVACALTAWLYWRGGPRGLKRAMLALAATYWLLATPLGARLLVASLAHGLTPLRSREEAAGIDTIVVLGAGANTYSQAGAVVGVVTSASAFRALEAARVFRLIGARVVIASGGIPRPERQLLPESRMIRDALVQAGVPSDSIVEESTSTTTVGEARLLRPVLRARGAERFILVTSPTHMRRSIAAFRHEGLDPVPSVAPLESDYAASPPLLLPNNQSRYLSDVAIYDLAAGVYYWWSGWTSDARGAATRE